MSRPYIIGMVAAITALAACGDGVGPPGVPADLGRPLHHLRWSPELGSPTFGALRDPVGNPELESPSQSTVRALDAHQVGFWARLGSDTGVEIRYLAADGTWQPYLRLSVPGDALSRRPDGSPFAAGDSLWITVEVDPAQLVVQLEPTGLVFADDAPAQLAIWYAGADPDLDGNGTVDGVDREIERASLGVWVQEGADTPWTAVTVSQAIDQKRFTAGLRHFSGYAVSH